MIRRMLTALTTLVLTILTVHGQPVPQVGGDPQRYSQVTEIDTCSRRITVSNGLAYRPGDRVLLVQMKGASLDTSKTSMSGQVISTGNAGRYQFNTVVESSASSVVLLHPFDVDFDVANNVQCIRIISGRSLRTNAPLVAAPWNGSTGGMLIVECSDTFYLNHEMSVRGRGFRGGAPSRNQADSNIVDYFIDIDNGRGGLKGEGPVVLPSQLVGGRAPSISGGGGGNAGNGGGGGGAMVSRGGTGGGQTTEYSSFPAGGIGGYPLVVDHSTLRLLVGGGGGGGHQNDFLGGNGGAGGGVVLIRAKVIVTGSTLRIDARGLPGDSTAGDGAGGGGSGGMVILDTDTIVGDVTVDVRGGDGGMAFPRGTACYAPGGGGSGGLIGIPVNRRLLSGNFFSDMDNGKAGVNAPVLFACIPSPALGATNGEIGEIVIVGPVKESSRIDSTPALRVRDTTVCSGGQAQLEVTGALAVRWAPADLVENPNNARTRTVALTSDTLLIATITFRGGCSIVDSVRVRVRPTPDTLSIAGIRGPCLGQETRYDFTWPLGNVSQWTVIGPGGTVISTDEQLVVQWQSSGLYTITADIVDDSSCASTVSTSVIVSDSLLPVISGIRPICAGDSLLLDAGSGYSTYLWSNGDTTATTIVRTPGSIEVRVSSANGCTGSSIGNLQAGRIPNPKVSALRTALESRSDSIVISLDDIGNSVRWSTGATTPSIVARRGGQYYATVVSEDGCEGRSDTIEILGYRLGPPILVHVGSVQYRPGETLLVPIELVTSEDRTEQVDVELVLETNATCVVPEVTATIQGDLPARAWDRVIDAESGTARLRFSVSFAPDQVGTYRVMVQAVGALGNAEVSDLTLATCVTGSDETECEIVTSGTATNLDVCKDLTPRLFDGRTRFQGISIGKDGLTWNMPELDASVRCFDALGRTLSILVSATASELRAKVIEPPAFMWWVVQAGGALWTFPVVRE